MRIGIIGGGAIGLLVAAYARKANLPVTLFTRTQYQKNEIDKYGIFLKVIDKPIENYIVHSKCFSIENIREVDFLFVAVKQYHLKTVVSQLGELGNELPPIAFLQNGMSHLHILDDLSAKNVFVAIVEHGALKENDMTVCHTGNGMIRLGVIRGNYSTNLEMLNKLSITGLSITYEEDWLRIMKQKLLVNVCINPLTALFGVRNGGLVDNNFYKQIMSSVFNEAIQVLELDHKEALWEYVLSICEKTANNRSSMLRDLDLKKETEIEAICGFILDEGKKQGKLLPIIQFLFDSIKGLELERRDPYE